MSASTRCRIQPTAWKAGRADLIAALKAFTAAPNESCSAEDARSVIAQFDRIYADASQRASGTTILNNAPLQRYSFGLGYGYLAHIDTSAPSRVQLQSGKIAPNAFTRSFAYAAVNLPLWGYDPSTFAPTARERVRPFVAIPFTPYFGIGAGASVLVTRALSVNAGWAELWYGTIKPGDAFDAAPSDKSMPFMSAHTGAWFVAAGVNFGGGK